MATPSRAGNGAVMRRREGGDTSKASTATSSARRVEKKHYEINYRNCIALFSLNWTRICVSGFLVCWGWFHDGGL